MLVGPREKAVWRLSCFCFTRLRFHSKLCMTLGALAEIHSEVCWPGEVARENSLT